MKEGLTQIKDVLIDRDIGSEEAVEDIGSFIKMLVYTSKILSSSKCSRHGGGEEERMIWNGIKQLDRALGLFKFVWETSGMKRRLELQGHLCNSTDHSKQLQHHHMASNTSNNRSKNPVNGGFTLHPHQSRLLRVPHHWSGRVWARQGCHFTQNSTNITCQTGDCNGLLQCNGIGGKPPATIVEMTFGTPASALHYYDVSLVDGFNLPVSVIPVVGNEKRNIVRLPRVR
ncbi:Thaumatin-like protein [Bienertia sinuspersici]